MARKSTLERVIAELKAELAYYDAELEAAGIEDATEWERFPEMERVMYALAERMVELESLRESDDELLEAVALAEESALAEIAAFGFTAPGYRREMWEFDPDEVVCFYEYDRIYDDEGYDLGFEDGCWPDERVLYELL